MIKTNYILTEVLTQALEKMAFLTVGPVDEEMTVPDQTVLAQMSFTGPKNGTIQILAGTEFAELLARNIGALDQADEENGYDALKELCNVTCGLLLPAMACSQKDVFDVTVPKVEPSGKAPKWEQFIEQPDCIVSNVEGYAVASRLIMKD